MPGIGPHATVDPGATLLGDARAYGYCTVGPNARLEGRVLLLDQASVDNCTIIHYERPGLVFAGDCLIESDDDWFSDDNGMDQGLDFVWAVYKTARTGPGGKHIWQSSAGCVRGIDMTAVSLDWHDPNVFKTDAGRLVGERTAQLARVRSEIAARGGYVGAG